MDRTPSSFLWYFVQKSSKTQTDDIPSDRAVWGGPLPERRRRALPWGTGAGVTLCRLGHALNEASCGSFPAFGPQVASPGLCSAPWQAYHLRNAGSCAPWVLASLGGLFSLQVQPPALGSHLLSCCWIAGNSPCCSCWDWVRKNSVSWDISASARMFSVV